MIKRIIIVVYMPHKKINPKASEIVYWQQYQYLSIILGGKYPQEIYDKYLCDQLKHWIYWVDIIILAIGGN